MTCPGPLIWFDIEPRPDRDELAAAILECATCDYVTMTGAFGNTEHADIAILKGGLAS
jgi:hypothetical protein